MRRISFLLVTAMLLFISTLQAQPTNLYVIGGATTTDWKRENAPEMTRTTIADTVVFSWTGYLDAIDESKEDLDHGFKFLLDRNAWDCYLATTANEPVVLDQPHALNTSGNDYKFIIPQAGNYTITVKIPSGVQNPSMTVTAFEGNDPDELYVIGSGLTTWEPAAAAPMTKVGAGLFRWQGRLNKSGDGDGIKFLPGNEKWTPVYVMGNNGGAGIEYTTAVSEDRKYNIDEPGDYLIEVNTLELTCKVSKLLYIVGDAIDEFDPSKAQQMHEVTPGWYSWCGTLKRSGDNNGEYKFLRSNSGWYPQYAVDYGNLGYRADNGSSTADKNSTVAEGEDGFYVVQTRTFYNASAFGMGNDSYMNKEERYRISEIFPIGEATDYLWDRSLTESMTVEPGNPYIWKDTLYLTPGNIKFLQQATGGDEAWSKPTISPISISDHTPVVVGEAMPAKFANTSYGLPDKQFVITELDNYVVTIDLQNYTVKFEVYTGGQQTGAKALPADSELLTVEYYTLQGAKVDRPQPNSVYIARKVYASGRVENVKVMPR